MHLCSTSASLSLGCKAGPFPSCAFVIGVAYGWLKIGSSRRSYFRLWLSSTEFVGMRPGFCSTDLGGVLTADVVKTGSLCTGVRPLDFIQLWSCRACRRQKFLGGLPMLLFARNAGVSRFQKASIKMTTSSSQQIIWDKFQVV